MKTPYTKSLDHLGLVATLCQELNIAGMVDQHLGQAKSKNREVSCGQLFVAMLLHGLGFTGRTLHMYSEYFQTKSIER